MDARRFWDADASEALIAKHYPSFLGFYKKNLTRTVEKSDMMRYIVLHHYGGERLYTTSNVF